VGEILGIGRYSAPSGRVDPRGGARRVIEARQARREISDHARGARELERSEEAGPVTATVDHAEIRGLGTSVQVSVAAPASL
jgi:hypothetical protein